MFPFIIVAAVLTAGLPPLTEVFFEHGWIRETPTFLYQTTWLVALMTSILFVYLYRSDKTAIFVQLYLLSMVVKLIAYVAYNLIVIRKEPEHAVANVAYFLIVYTLFTVLEIAVLYRKVSPPSRP